MGGEFSTTRWSCILDKTVYQSSIVDWYGREWFYQAPMIPSIHDSYGTAFEGWGYITKDTPIQALANRYPALSHSDNELLAFGTTAIARTRPDISPTSLSQFLVELRRDGIPFASKLTKARLEEIVKGFNKKGASAATHSTKEASDVFLEHTFGLQPMVSDLKDFVAIQSKGLSVIDRLLANDGKMIRRRYRFPDEKVSTTEGHGSADQFGFTAVFPWSNEKYVIGPSGPVDRPTWSPFTVDTVRKVWFSGAYAVHLPKDFEPLSRLRAAADKLRWDYGLGLDISTLYNLAPWTWLIDWQFNLGDLITNVSKWSDDNVVLQYGYIMEETTSDYVVSADGYSFNDRTAPNRHIPGMGIRVHKKRRLRATPYGFGLTYGSLSDYQKAILAAIGITRF
jgi:hypothetical protein